MGNQNPKESLPPLADVPKPANPMPELSQVNMHDSSLPQGAPSFSMLANATQFGAFTFPELPTLDLQSALPSISAPDLTLPSVSLPSIQSFQQKTKEIRDNIGHELQIGIGATMIDINGLVNDYGTIDKVLYRQNYAAGKDLLNRYQQKLFNISERNNLIQYKASQSSAKLNKIMAYCINSQSNWNLLQTQLSTIPAILESLNATKSRISAIASKLALTEKILTDDSVRVLDIPFQKLKEEQAKQLESTKYSNKVQLANYGNVLEQQRQDSIAHSNSQKILQQKKEGEKEQQILREKKRLLSTQFLQESEDFAIYGNVLPANNRRIATPTVSKLEDVKIDYEHAGMESELDQFFSSKPAQMATDTIRDDEDKEENTITYLDDEVPDFM